MSRADKVRKTLVVSTVVFLTFFFEGVWFSNLFGISEADVVKNVETLLFTSFVSGIVMVWANMLVLILLGITVKPLKRLLESPISKVFSLGVIATVYILATFGSTNLWYFLSSFIVTRPGAEVLVSGVSLSFSFVANTVIFYGTILSLSEYASRNGKIEG